MQAKDALCVAAVFLVYPGIKTARDLGGDEFVERDSEDRCPYQARKVVCHLQDPRVTAADVSSSQQECYYYGNRENHTLSVLIISSSFYCKYKQFPLKVQGGNPYFLTETTDIRRNKPIQTCLFINCHAEVAKCDNI